jgi:hypothetical protein
MQRTRTDCTHLLGRLVISGRRRPELPLPAPPPASWRCCAAIVPIAANAVGRGLFHRGRPLRTAAHQQRGGYDGHPSPIRATHWLIDLAAEVRRADIVIAVSRARPVTATGWKPGPRGARSALRARVIGSGHRQGAAAHQGPRSPGSPGWRGFPVTTKYPVGSGR